MNAPSTPLGRPIDDEPSLAGRRVAFVGRLAGMSKREAQQLVRSHGAIAVEVADAETELVVVGEEGFPLAAVDEPVDVLEGVLRTAAEQGTLEVLRESDLWRRLGMVDDERDVRRLYTPAMLAGLVGVPVATIRRWHRRGLIQPLREVRRLPYFDFQEVTTARRLAEVLAAGVSPQALERKLAALARFLPDVERPLAQLPIILAGKELLLRQGEGLLEPGGQLRFDFDAAAVDAEPAVLDVASAGYADTPEAMFSAAEELDDAGDLEGAAEAYRAVLAAGGPNAEVCFRLAELLYRLGDLSAARERYSMALELDEDYVEARANLGCVLEELGRTDLAEAAFRGAIAMYEDFPDAHYHLARLLDLAGQADEAEQHWRRFSQLAPESPWADEARVRLATGPDFD
ncbi:MAG: tetratricopeptide repeat protein [Pirellulales bacterium]|nr:tetratricopeptide repeat protein [Pirellulales bacterium]